LKYGYYFKTFGIKFNYYKPTGFLSGAFNNVNLDEVTGIKTKLFETLYRFKFFNYVYQKAKKKRQLIQNKILKW